MTDKTKIKLLISFAILLVAILITVVIIQIVDITKTKKELANQQQQINELTRELDYHKNKESNSDFETIN